MDRRAFLSKSTLSLATAGATAALVPRWIQDRLGTPPDRCDPPLDVDGRFVDAPPAPAEPPESTCSPLPGPAATMADAVARARAVGKPLLVLVIPDEERWKQGYAFGSWLQHCPPHTAAGLALVEVACATFAELCSSYGLGLTRKEPPTLALMRADEDPPCVSLVAYVDVKPSWEAADVDSNITALSEKLGHLLTHFDEDARAPEAWTGLPDMPLVEPTLVRLAALARRASPCEPPALDELASLPLAEIDRHAAAIALAAIKLDHDAGARRDFALRLLADAARARLVLGPMTERPWAIAGGCGTRVEGEEPEVGIACGMGHVPEKARRFLYLYTKAERAKLGY